MSTLKTTSGNHSTYEVSWYVPGHVVLLTLEGDYRIDTSKEVNLKIINHLEQGHSSIVLLIDATKMSRPRNFQQIRLTQTYMYHKNLKQIFIVANDKVISLAMMIIFHLSSVYLQTFADFEQVNKSLPYRGSTKMMQP